MSYCVNCGVELDNSTLKCPLCDTPVINPNILKNQKEKENKMSVENKKVDIDYTNEVVPSKARKGFFPMFAIMLGFTFFSASMWTGVDLANGLDLKGFMV